MKRDTRDTRRQFTCAPSDAAVKVKVDPGDHGEMEKPGICGIRAALNHFLRGAKGEVDERQISISIAPADSGDRNARSLEHPHRSGRTHGSAEFGADAVLPRRR